METFFGIAVFVVFVAIYAWSWRRIAAYFSSKGWNRWLAHGAGLILGQLPALCLPAAVGMLGASADKSGPSIGEAVFVFAVCIFSVVTTYRCTRLPPAKQITSHDGSDEDPHHPITTAPLPVIAEPEISHVEHREISAPSHQIGKQISASNVKETKKKANTTGAQLDEIMFIYRGRNDLIAKERRVSVRAVNGDYLEGHCHTQGATRTFRIANMRGGITSMQTGEIVKKMTWVKEMQRHPDNGVVVSGSDYRSSGFSAQRASGKNDQQTSIMFTGFKKAEREAMEALAEEAGWKIRKTVSATLDYLIAGDNAGPTKIKEAETLGIDMVPIIDEHDFRDWMAAEIEVL